ncbi:unnamed protein product [Rotaria socialis]|uniref:Cortactin-binding protein-2 N-terminal domain-containing protein n=1 Tax=Rotaria socialis TaxID=392032 RepID=A0A820B7Z6_9BILA|nr:unnamed protein product [Rotaria socialis]
MATTMLTSTPTKEKKKHSSPNKQNRSNIAGTLKRNPKYELKKDELIQLLGRFEAELQAKDIALAALKSEKVKTLLSNARFGRLSCQTDPYAALLRDSEHVKEDVLNEQVPMKNAYETQLVQLEELIVQQRKQVHTLKFALDDAHHRFALLAQELENEKKEKARLKAFQNQLLTNEEEKIQLHNELENVKLHSQELEQQLTQVIKLLENEHERHKKFVILLLNERKVENEHHQEQLKQLSNNHTNDDTKREARFKELELENERTKQLFTARIQQLQSEIDLLVKEKKQQTITNNIPTSDGELAETFAQPQSKSRQLPPTVTQTTLPTNDPPSLPFNAEKPFVSTTGGIRRPTIIPAPSTSKNSTNLIKKSGVAPLSLATHPQQTSSMTNSTSSISELPISPVPAVAKRNIIPTRSIYNVSQSPIISNPRSSTINSQTTTSSMSTVSSITGNNATRGGGGIPRLTKNPHQIVKPTTTTTTTTGPAKRPGQTSFSSEHKVDDLRTLLETIHTVAENRLTSSTDIADSPSCTDKNDLNSTSSSSSLSPSHPDIIIFRAAENGDTGMKLTVFVSK